MTASGPNAVVPPDFDAAYRAVADPWAVESSWYEQRKLALTLAALPRQSYRAAWEPGCGPGLTTEQLAMRADRVVASDASGVAVATARRRLSALAHVQVAHSVIPESPLTEQVDLVVAAEFVYYIEDWETAMDALWSAVRPGGNLVLVHWAHHPHDAYRSGRALHALAAVDASTRGAQAVVTHTEPHFTIDVYEAAP